MEDSFYIAHEAAGSSFRVPETKHGFLDRLTSNRFSTVYITMPITEYIHTQWHNDSSTSMWDIWQITSN